MLISDHLTDLKEAFLKRNLESHEAFLEHEALLLCEAARDDHSTAPHNQSSGFRDDQNFVAQLGQVLCNGCKRSCLSGAGASSYEDARHVDFVLENFGPERSTTVYLQRLH